MIVESLNEKTVSSSDRPDQHDQDDGDEREGEDVPEPEPMGHPAFTSCQYLRQVSAFAGAASGCAPFEAPRVGLSVNCLLDQRDGLRVDHHEAVVAEQRLRLGRRVRR